MPLSFEQRALLRQITNSVVLLLVAIAAILEAVWIFLLLWDPSQINRTMTVTVHALAAVAIVALVLHQRKRGRRRTSTSSWNEPQYADSMASDLSFKLRVLRFPVSVQYIFFLVPAMMAFEHGGVIRPLAFIASVTIAVLLHELGHAIVARQNRQAAAITLHIMGGVTTYFGPRLSRAKSFAISFAGPAVGLVLGTVVYFATRDLALPPLAGGIIWDFIFVNAGWAVFNLLPILPLDGGKLVAALSRNPSTAPTVSIIVAVILAIICFMTGYLMTGVFLVILAGNNFLSHPKSRGLNERLSRGWEERG